MTDREKKSRHFIYLELILFVGFVAAGLVYLVVSFVA
jgi:hypothetical protein